MFGAVGVCVAGSERKSMLRRAEGISKLRLGYSGAPTGKGDCEAPGEKNTPGSAVTKVSKLGRQPLKRSKRQRHGASGVFITIGDAWEA